jgi:Ser/Thr protein kinase RdoA (MazF antagonist)
MTSSVGAGAAGEVLPFDIFRRWGVVPEAISLIQERSNAHWTVTRDGRPDLVLRRYRGEQSAESIEYEFEVLRVLARHGQPVAAPIGPPVRDGGHFYALFPMLLGTPKPEEDVADARLRGQLLGRLHLDLAEAARLGQRPGWQRTDTTVIEAAGRGLELPSPGLPSEDVAVVAEHLEKVADRLAEALGQDAPTGVVHGDFINQNLLFTGATLTGLLDLDSTHLDLRAADLACARRSSGDEVVRGYLDVVALTDAEVSVLGELWQAGVLRYASQIIGATHRIADPATELAWCLRQLLKTQPFSG